MFGVHGLYGHIQKNNFRSLTLVFGFIVSFELLCLAFWAPGFIRMSMAMRAMDGASAPVSTHLLGHAEVLVRFCLLALLPAMVWFLVSLAMHVHIVRGASAFQLLERHHERRLHAIVETVAIGFGLPMPAIAVMPGAERNALTCGFSPRSAVLVVTRGLLDALDDDELAAVVAHEMSHIRNRDIRLMAVVFVLTTMIKTFARALMWRTWPLLAAIVLVLPFVPAAAAMMADVAAVVVVAAGAGLLLALVLRFAISRAREFVADAEAVAYTHRPQALISALHKLEGQVLDPAIAGSLRPMMMAGRVEGWFGTHPSLAARIAALRAYAGAALPDTGTRRDTRPPSPARATFGTRVGLSGVPATTPQATIWTNLRGAVFGKSATAAGGAGWTRHVQTVVLAISVIITYALMFAVDALTPHREPVVGTLACFGLDGDDPYHPGTAPFFARLVPGSSNSLRGGDTYQRMLIAKVAADEAVRRDLAACPRLSCEAERETALKDSLLAYVKRRKIVTRWFDEAYGAPGLAYAQKLYTTPLNADVVAALKTWHETGRLGLKPHSQIAAEVTLMTSQPHSAFTPCRGPDNAPSWSAPQQVERSGDWSAAMAAKLWK